MIGQGRVVGDGFGWLGPKNSQGRAVGDDLG
jgi:hypothetical protein